MGGGRESQRPPMGGAGLRIATILQIAWCVSDEQVQAREAFFGMGATGPKR